jgi:hypothetical protein
MYRETERDIHREAHLARVIDIDRETERDNHREAHINT